MSSSCCSTTQRWVSASCMPSARQLAACSKHCRAAFSAVAARWMSSLGTAALDFHWTPEIACKSSPPPRAAKGRNGWTNHRKSNRASASGASRRAAATDSVGSRPVPWRVCAEAPAMDCVGSVRTTAAGRSVSTAATTSPSRRARCQRASSTTAATRIAPSVNCSESPAVEAGAADPRTHSTYAKGVRPSVAVHAAHATTAGLHLPAVRLT